MRRPMRAFVGFLGTFLFVALGLAWALVVLGADVVAVRWDRPWLLLLLAVVPLVLILGTVAEELRIPRLRFGSIGSARNIPQGFRARFSDLPAIMRAASLTLIVVALARPQSIVAAETDERRGIDIMVALDLSGSMRAADLLPTRLAAAKAVVQDFIKQRSDSDRIGAVIFAKEAFLLSAPTFDHARLGQLVGRMTLGLVNGDGTAIGDGLATALARLRHSKASSRVVVLLTDGDNNAGWMSPEYATDVAKELCVKVYTVQMGNGDEVPVEVERDPFGRPIYARQKFPVKPEVLRKIAADTGGEAYIANKKEELDSSMHAILNNLTKTTFEAASGDVVDRYPLVIIPAAILVILEALVRAFILRRFP